jgi:DNA-binding NtrC family response regulator
MRKPQILVVDDEADIRELIQEILSEEGYDVATAADAAEARTAVQRRPPNLVLLDIWMPDLDGISLLKEWQNGRHVTCPVVMLSGHGTVETAMEATRLGAADFVEKPLSLAKLLRTVEKALQGTRPGRAPGTRPLLPPIIAAPGRSRRIRELREQAEQLASHTSPVLVIGESGTGREGLARYIHEAGQGRDQPFVAVAGGTLLATNAAQLLLGAETSQGREAGCIERAGTGTVFIGDIEDVTPEGQRLLLGILEQGSYTPLGRAAPVALTARFSASARPATVADPAAQGVRVELIARLGMLQLRVPPLREYAEDMSELLRYFVDDFVEREGLAYRRFSFAAQNRLRNYPWPGNLRELASLTQRLLAVDGAEEISLDEVEQALPPSGGTREPLVKQDLLALPLREAREEFERAYLTEQLALCGGKVGALAKRVGMERTHLYRKLRSLGVEFKPTPGEE